MQVAAHRLTRIVLALVALAAAGPTCAGYDIETFGYPGSDFTQPFGINDKGLVVGSLPDPPGAFVYDAKRKKFTNLPPLPGYMPQAMGINESGVIVGNAFLPDPVDPNGPGSDFGFILKDGTYTLIAYPGFGHTIVRAIGNSGLVTGEAYNDDWDGGFPAFIYDPTLRVFNEIAIPGALLIHPQGMDGQGRVVGSVYLDRGGAYPGSPVGFYGFVREPNAAVTLFSINSRQTQARGINDSGQITGFVNTEVSDRDAAFVITLPALCHQALTVPETELIGVREATTTKGQAIDSSGRVVGGWSDSAGKGYGFIATPIPKGRR